MSTRRTSRLWLAARLCAFSLAAIGIANESVATANAYCFNCVYMQGFGNVCDYTTHLGWTNCYMQGSPDTGGVTCQAGGNACSY